MGSEIMGYGIRHEIGKGGFGKVYEVRRGADPTPYALKIESPTHRGRKGSVANEIQAYCDLQGCPEIPQLVDHGVYRGLNFLVLPLLRYSLKDLLERHPKFFTRKSATIVGKRLLSAIEFIHARGRLYRDFKPENVMLGHDNRVYLIDFGMSVPYLSEDGSHIPEGKGKRASGTLWYVSVNTDRGMEQSRRDDLESLFYLLILLYKSRLPWMDVGTPISKRCQGRARKIKEGMCVSKLCEGICGKQHLVRFFQYVVGLGFEERPDYLYLNTLLDKVLCSNREDQELEEPDKTKEAGVAPVSLWNKLARIICPSNWRDS